MRAINNEWGDLYGVCLRVSTRIRDVKVEQNFFVLNSTTYHMILEQPYIMATRIETKVSDDGFYYRSFKNYYKKNSIQFFIMRLDYERNRDWLKEVFLRINEEFLDF